jgi:hypothetical protein
MESSKPEAQVHELKQPRYTASIHCSEEALPENFVKGVKAIEKSLGMPVWMLIQNNPNDDFGTFDPPTWQGLRAAKAELEPDKPVALLVDSPGGDPRVAYKIAQLLNVRCGEYVVVVPCYAKSAATLLALGAARIILGSTGELGPLDMQVRDTDSEEDGSALNHVQTLERLSAFELRTFDQAMFLMLRRTSKKVSNILPLALEFASASVRPLMENVDVVKYTEMSRLLKVGESYAERLLRKKYGAKRASDIAAKLVSEYPEHGFVIEHNEAKAIGLHVETASHDLETAFDSMSPCLDSITAIGRLSAAGDGS